MNNHTSHDEPSLEHQHHDGHYNYHNVHTMYIAHIITMQTNTCVSNEHKHQDIKEQTSHLNTSYTKNEMKSTSALEI
jgi:hypothetical protein